MSYEKTEDPHDPLTTAYDAIERASGEVLSIRLGPLDAMDRAALDRAKNNLKAAVARIEDVLRETQPTVTYPHPGRPRVNAP